MTGWRDTTVRVGVGQSVRVSVNDNVIFQQWFYWSLTAFVEEVRLLGYQGKLKIRHYH